MKVLLTTAEIGSRNLGPPGLPEILMVIGVVIKSVPDDFPWIPNVFQHEFCKVCQRDSWASRLALSMVPPQRFPRNQAYLGLLEGVV